MSGYGYRKKLCRSVSDWFVSEFLSDYTIDLHITHRGLKRELVYGWCDFEDDFKEPRAFLIQLQSHMDVEQYIKVLIHELVHVRQWVYGILKYKKGKTYYKTIDVDELDYDDQPHEIEAREMEVVLYKQYLAEVQCELYRSFIR